MIIPRILGKLPAPLFASICISLLAPRASGADYYIAQAARGTGAGTSAANAAAYTFFNNSSNWSATAATAGAISPGDTVHLEGNLTSQLIVEGSGLPAHPVTVLFDPGASMNAPSGSPWGTTGAISCQDRSYIIIDGGATGTIGGSAGDPAAANGVISNVNNGSTDPNYPLQAPTQLGSVGIYISYANNITVRGLEILNIYNHTTPADETGGGTSVYATALAAGGGNMAVTNCILKDAYEGFSFSYEVPGSAGASNVTMSYCTAYNCNWGGDCGDGNSNMTMTGVYVHDNWFHDWANWDSTSNYAHHNGYFVFAAHDGSSVSLVRFYNNLLTGSWGANATSGLFIQYNVYDAEFYNNTFVPSAASPHPNDGFMFLDVNADLVTAGSQTASYEVFNNTFLSNATTQGLGLNISPRGSGSGAQTFTVENNIFDELEAGIGVFTNATATLISNYNCFFGLNPTQGFSWSPNSSAAFLTMAQWQALGHDANSSSSNPNLDAIFVPQLPSSVIGAGTNLSAFFTTDADGFPRSNSGAWDMGAFVSLPSDPPVLNSSRSITARQGSSFLYTITATNSPTSYDATGLPAGLSVNTGTGVISGVPTVPGTYPIMIAATNAGGTSSETATLFVDLPAPVLTSATSATAAVGSTFSYTITATNSPLSFNATGLPAGLSLNTSTGLITGVPTTAGTFTFLAYALNGGGTNHISVTLTVVQAALPAITSAANASGAANANFTYVITASNSPTGYNATGLPAGLSVNRTTGVITGIPTVFGLFNVTISATNADGTASAALALVVIEPSPVVTSAVQASAIQGSSFSYAVTASNLPTSYNAVGLPAGLSINPATGLIAGIPTVFGLFSVTISATNSGGTGSATLALSIVEPIPGITSLTARSAMQGSSFSYAITASNSPTSYSAVGLPAGLSINPTTGAIAGIPTVFGLFSVTIGATNAGGTGSAVLALAIVQPSPVITSATTALVGPGASLTYAITASNSPTSYNAVGLPAGLSINLATGIISGTPAVAGVFNVTISAANSGGTGTAILTITVIPYPPVINSSRSITARQGSSFSSYTITATNSPTSYNATGLPPGLSINPTTGAITGVPTVPGTYPITLFATNAGGTGSITATLFVDLPAPVLTSATNATAAVGSTFSYTITATNSPLSFNATGLPAGLSLNTSTGLITGVPTTAGTFTFLAYALNGGGTNHISVTVVVLPSS